jgi:hypothetical protein
MSAEIRRQSADIRRHGFPFPRPPFLFPQTPFAKPPYPQSHPNAGGGRDANSGLRREGTTTTTAKTRNPAPRRLGAGRERLRGEKRTGVFR